MGRILILNLIKEGEKKEVYAITKDLWEFIAKALLQTRLPLALVP